MALNEGRGAYSRRHISPGCCWRRRSGSLNEGRGAYPGDTRARVWGKVTVVTRSTKAGALTPATHGVPRHAGCHQVPLNEGRGAYPGDTRLEARSEGRTCSLNEGRGAYPGDTSSTGRRLVRDCEALNEGRGAYPGDTLFNLDGDQVGDARSTKAGALTPATPCDTDPTDLWGCRAQRRPGRLPRRHADGRARQLAGERRSTKAGALTPATLQTRSDHDWRSAPLNEGRGAYPGDTRSKEDIA